MSCIVKQTGGEMQQPTVAEAGRSEPFLRLLEGRARGWAGQNQTFELMLWPISSYFSSSLRVEYHEKAKNVN